MLRKPELEQRESREYRKFRRPFRISYEFLELVQLAKHRKWFLLAARDVAGRQCLPVVLEDSQMLLLILPKMRCVWFGFEMTPKHRQNGRTVLYYSRLYYTIVQYIYWPVQTVQYNTCIWLKPERRVLCCCISFLAKNRDSAMMAMVPLCMMVHPQVAVLLPGGEARAMY